MLPTGMPSLALISAYGTGGSWMSRAIKPPVAGGQVGECLAQRHVALRHEHLLLDHLSLIVWDGLGIQRIPGSVWSAHRA